jgi:hypothetical protein
MRGWLAGVFALVVLGAITVGMPATAAGDEGPSNDIWEHVDGTPPRQQGGRRAEVDAKRFRAYRLNRARIGALLRGAPRERARGRQRGLVIALPAPSGKLQRFELVESPVMEDGLAAEHPEIRTFSGRGVDDPNATLRADLTPLGFHASVRSPDGAWYVDPYYHLDESLYASYYARDASTEDGVFVEKDGDAEAAAADVETAEVPVGPSVTLRTYRLALVTDPSYATYFGGPANVTAAKVTLINRVDQIYEDETAIRLVLIDDTEKTNLNTAADATGANGPCGSAACFTAAQLSTCGSGTLSRNRIVLGQIVGASNYDVGHIGLGVNGGGVASLGVVGGNGKAQGCTGLPTPVGDFFAVDYVAHEMGHQFSGNHTFNGTQLNCSGGNRNGANSVEPASGSSIMAYAGICQQDNLQPHSDPYWSQRSFTEITTYVTSDRAAINEVQTVSLRDFDGTDSFRITFNGNQTEPIVRGTSYTTAGITAALLAMPGWPVGGTATVAAFGGAGALNDTGFQVTFGGTLAALNQTALGLADTNGATGFVGETAKGGAIDNKGFTAVENGNHAPVVTTAMSYTIPVRTPFALTGSATDSDGDTVTYLWEQNNRGGATGTALVNNTKVNGPLFRQFGVAAIVSATDTLLTPSPGLNAVGTDPTRVFPDLPQILVNNTNAATGSCPAAPAAPAIVPAATVDCYSEFLPTSAWIGFVNAAEPAPRTLRFRLTARDGHPGGGGVGFNETSLVIEPTAGPFLVTSHASGAAISGGSTQAVAWNRAGTDLPPVGVANVKISLSTDGGLTYPTVLAASTPNDGAQDVVVPNVAVEKARIKVEAVDNVFFDLNDADFAIKATPAVTNDAPAGGAHVQYSDALAPTVTVSASDADSPGSALTATATGLPAGTTLVDGTNSGDSALPGQRTWKVSGATTAAPGTYAVSVAVSDGGGQIGSTAFQVVVTAEDATAAYTGDILALAPAGGSSATATLRASVTDRDDGSRGNAGNATVAFKEGSTVLCGPVAVTAGADPTTGSASCTATLPLGIHTVDVVVGGSYAGSATGTVQVDPAVVDQLAALHTLIAGFDLRNAISRPLQDDVTLAEKALSKARGVCDPLNDLMATAIDFAGSRAADMPFAQVLQLLAAANRAEAGAGCHLLTSPRPAAEASLVGLLQTIDGMNLRAAEAASLSGLVKTLAKKVVSGSDETCTRIANVRATVQRDVGKGELTQAQADTILAVLGQVGAALGCTPS